MPKYPGAALFTNIVAYASKHGRLPSAVYDDYRRHPNDYQLVFSHDFWQADEEQKAIGKSKPNSESTGRPTRLGHS